MNKEQFIDTLQACYFGDRGAFNKILKEYKELHNKIDKAIKYINGAWEMGCYTKTVALYSEELEELLEILNDSDVDE